MFNEAVIAGEKALKLAPDNALIKNNLKVALDGLNASAKTKSADEYFRLSLTYYVLGDYEACIKQGGQALRLDPENPVTYNNICSAYNALGQYQEAVKACEHALRIAPDFALAKNNLNAAKKAINP